MTDQEQRLSRITTHWTLMLEAHREQEGELARGELALRYIGAAYQYLLGAVRSTETAEELCQEFATRFLEGKFKGADPERGRFRDYVKRVLANLIRDHYNARQKWPQALGADHSEPPQPADADAPGENFVAKWREELLNQTWRSLQDQRPKYYLVLRAKIEMPDHTSRQLSEHLAVNHATEVSSANVRKTLERAHAKFADLLVDEVARSLGGSASEEVLRDEMEQLDLLRFCRTALERHLKATR